MLGVWIVRRLVAAGQKPPHGCPDGMQSHFIGDMTHARALEFCRLDGRFNCGWGVRFTPPYSWTSEALGEFFSRESAEEFLST